MYLGAAPGVGKTFAMLDEGRRRAARGTDVAIGLVETHGRAATAAAVAAAIEAGAELVERRVIEHRGTRVEELDTAAVIARAPEVVLVDELAHTNVAGSSRTKRWEDIDDLLAAGIDVISTVNIQHLESVNDVVERITGVRQTETVPDAWVRAAEQVQLVDMTPEALRRRMAHGNVYSADRIDAALGNWFRVGNLGALRELALLWVADRVEDDLQEYLEAHAIDGAWETRERILVALTGAPDSEAVIRRAARLARRNQAELIGVHISPADGLVDRRGPYLDGHRRLLEELGGTYREAAGDDIAETLVALARVERVTQIVIGASRRSRSQELARGSIVNDLLRLARDLDVHVISAPDSIPDPAGGLPRAATGLSLWARLRTPLPRRRRTAAWLVLALGGPVLFLALYVLRDQIGVPTSMLLGLTLVVAVGTIGGQMPGLVAAVTCSVAINVLVVPPYGRITVTEAENVIALIVFIVVGATVATLVDRIARRSAESAHARAEADSLTRAASALATEADPLPSLLAEVRSSLRLGAVSLLHRNNDDDERWTLVAAAGDDPPTGPGAHAERAVSADGAWLLVFDGDLDGDGVELLESLVSQLGVAVDALRLRQEAAAAEALIRAEELRSGILQAVSHDLRTPLAAIKAVVTSLLSPDMTFGPEDTHEFLTLVDEEVDRLDRVIGNLLDMSRLQSNTMRVLRMPTAVEDVLSAAVAGLDTTLSDDRSSHRRVEMRVPADLPLIDVDAALVERAVANVVANAIAVQPEGTAVVVDAGVVGNRVHVRVVDRGPGIRPADRVRVRAPFQRMGDRSTQAGVGLGLAIASGFTNAVGGRLDLDDTPGGGLTATFELPVADQRPAGEAPHVLRPELGQDGAMTADDTTSPR